MAVQCEHLERRGRYGDIRWCSLRQQIVSERSHCHQCEQRTEYRIGETDTRQEGPEAMAASKGHNWDGPAGEAVEGAPMDVSLWEWARAEIAGGRTRSEVAREIGVGANTMRYVIDRREAGGQPVDLPWDGPAGETVEDARMDISLREWAENGLTSGRTADSIGEQLGCSAPAVRMAVKRGQERKERQQRQQRHTEDGGPDGSRAALAPMRPLRAATEDGETATDDGGPRPASPVERGEGQAAVVELTPGGEADQAMDEFLRRRGLTEEAKLFCEGFWAGLCAAACDESSQAAG